MECVSGVARGQKTVRSNILRLGKCRREALRETFAVLTHFPAADTMVETIGIEPTTSSLRTTRSPN